MKKELEIKNYLKELREDLDNHYNSGEEDNGVEGKVTWMYEISDRELMENYGSEEMVEEWNHTMIILPPKLTIEPNHSPRIQDIINDIEYQYKWILKESSTIEQGDTEMLLLSRDSFMKIVEDINNELYGVKDTQCFIDSRELETDDEEEITKRVATIIYNLMGKYMDLYGGAFEEDYGSEGEFLSDEILLTYGELEDYTRHMKGDDND